MLKVKSKYIRYYVILLALLLSTKIVYSQDLLPYVENFTKADYKGDNQVWNITQGADNAIYAANGRYFLRYNGVSWEKHMLPNKTVIRALYPAENRIYSGSYNEFGYWTRVDGVMQYTSLATKYGIFNQNKRNDEIWKIFKVNDTIYFQSFNNLYKLSGDTLETINIPFLISYCFVIEGKIYVCAVNNGIYTYENETFNKIESWNAIDENIIHGLDNYNNTPYIFTKKNGVYTIKNNKPIAWDHPINPFLKTHLINAAHFVGDKLLIGTAFHGLYVIDMKTNEWYAVNRSNALKNNSVLTMLTDSEENVWLGLDNGISRVEINTPLQFFYDNSGELGSVYTIAITNNGYLLGSNHGVFNYKNRKLNLIPNSEGQVWQIDDIQGKYIVGHNDATYLYKNERLEKISNVNGGWKMIKNPFSSNYFQASYSGIAFYNDLSFKDYKKLNDFTNPIKNIEQIAPYELWAADYNKSLYKIKLTTDYEVESLENITKNAGFTNDYFVKMFKFKNELFFLINNNWYTYNKIKNSLEENVLFNNEFENVTDVIPIDDNNFLVLKNNILQLVNHAGEEFIWKIIPPKYYSGRLIIQDTKAIEKDKHLIINLDDGFLIYNTENSLTNNNAPEIDIEGYYENKLISEKTEIDYNKTVKLDVISNKYGFEKPILYYKHNFESEFTLLNNNTIYLNNLWTGNQNISIYYKKGRNYIKLKDYEFYVKSPWYFSTTLIIIYIAVIGLIFFLYYRWNKVRYKQKLKLKEEELKHQNNLEKLKLDTENQLKLQEYEKHILEMQVQTKASEVAGKSLSIAKQSEMIDSIKRILENENDVTKVKTKIKKAIKTNVISKNEWASFEKNLFQSNEEFVKKLTDNYPELTPKDIKLCIYLKMSLSSKEIAPLMNISYRGVELHRYRLRKKLDLETETNLNKFLLNL